MELPDIYTPSWFVIQTRFQKEKVANEHLLNQRIPTLYPREEVFDSRSRPTHRPYFQRYLFAKFPLVMLSQVRSTRGVSRIVEFIAGEPLSVEDHIIAEIAARMNGDGVVVRDKPLTASNYQQDDLVMVTYGPLSGIAGLFKGDVGDGERVILLLKMLGREFNQPIPMRDTRKALLSELAYV